MGATTTIIAVAAVASAAISAAGAISQADAAKKQSKAQARVLEQQAARERENAKNREVDFRRDQSRLMAERRAILAASGVESGEGSPLLTSEDFAGESELAALRIRAGGDVAATRLQQQAGLVRAAGRAEQTAGFFRAGSLLVAGAGKAFGLSGGFSSRIPAGVGDARDTANIASP